jgi:4-hydroxybenzoyl-CoA reductase subunit alpha
VVTGPDAPNPFGILPVGHDEHALALDKVRYVGDNVACVAAISESIAEKAVDLIDVEYELLPAYFDPDDSMTAETDLIHDNKPHNLERDYHHVFGDPDKGFATADCVMEARYLANEVTHAAMEPHSTLASIEIDHHTGQHRRLTVWSSTQDPYYLQHKLSLVLNMPGSVRSSVYFPAPVVFSAASIIATDLPIVEKFVVGRRSLVVGINSRFSVPGRQGTKQ